MRFQAISSIFLTIFVATLALFGRPVSANEPVLAEIKVEGSKVTAEIHEESKDQVAARLSAASGIVFVSEKVHDQISEPTADADWLPVKNGYVSRLSKSQIANLGQKIKYNFVANQRLYTAIVGATISASSLVTGMIIAHDPITLESLSGIPIAMALSFTVWANRDTMSVYFNYHNWTPGQFMRTSRLAKEYLKTGNKPPELVDANLAEKLTKLYLLEAAFMGLTTIGGAAFSWDLVYYFVSTSIAYTLVTTYDLIIFNKRDLKIAANPERAETIKIAANFISIGFGFLDNVIMMVGKSGGSWGMASIWAGAILINAYYFGWEPLKIQLQKFRSSIFAENSALLCSSVF